jgi:Cu/Ag efflux protein CusF
MRKVYSTRLGTALAVAALAAGAAVVLAADQKNRADAGKEITITGRIIHIRPADGRLTLQTLEGDQLELSVDSQSQLSFHQHEAKLSQFKEGTRVRVTYSAAGGNNRVISLREAPVTAEELRQELRDALETAKAYTFQQKEKYQRRLEPVLRDLDDRIGSLREQAKDARKEARKKYGEAIKELQRERQVVREQLDKVQAATPGAWEEAKAGMSAAWDDLRKAFQRAHERFKEENPDKP